MLDNFERVALERVQLKVLREHSEHFWLSLLIDREPNIIFDCSKSFAAIVGMDTRDIQLRPLSNFIRSKNPHDKKLTIWKVNEHGESVYIGPVDPVTWVSPDGDRVRFIIETPILCEPGPDKEYKLEHLALAYLRVV